MVFFCPHVLNQIRLAFSQPVSNRVYDSYFVHCVMRAMDEVDSLKREGPILGEGYPLDYGLACGATIPEQGMTTEQVTSELLDYCSGLPIPGYPQTQQNVVPHQQFPR